MFLWAAHTNKTASCLRKTYGQPLNGLTKNSLGRQWSRWRPDGRLELLCSKIDLTDMLWWLEYIRTVKTACRKVAQSALCSSSRCSLEVRCNCSSELQSLKTASLANSRLYCDFVHCLCSRIAEMRKVRFSSTGTDSFLNGKRMPSSNNEKQH